MNYGENAQTGNVTGGAYSRRRPGFIYVAEVTLRDGARGWRVGHTVNLRRRVYEHARWDSLDFVLVAVGRGTRAEEEELHRALHGATTGRYFRENYPDTPEFRAWVAQEFRALWRGRIECSDASPARGDAVLPFTAEVARVADLAEVTPP